MAITTGLITTVTQLQQHFDTDRVTELATENGTYDVTILEEIIDTVVSGLYSTLSKQLTSTQINADLGLRRIGAILIMYALEMRRGSTTTKIQQMYDIALQKIEQYKTQEIKPAAVVQTLPPIQQGPSEIFEQGGYFEGLPDLSTTATEDFGSRDG